MQVANNTQIEKVKQILLTQGQIDNFSAINSRLSLRLGAIIFVLRNQGFVINTQRQKDRNTIYKLIEAPKEHL